MIDDVNMTGRSTNFKTKRPRYSRGDGRQGRQSPNSKLFLERDSHSPPNLELVYSGSERSSPVSITSNRNSSDSEDERGILYAGAKFNSPPPAYVLPTPPSTWLVSSQMEQVALQTMSLHLRQLLKVSV